VITVTEYIRRWYNQPRLSGGGWKEGYWSQP